MVCEASILPTGRIRLRPFNTSRLIGSFQDNMYRQRRIVFSNAKRDNNRCGRDQDMKYKVAVVVMLAALTASAADKPPRIRAGALKAMESHGKQLAIIDPGEQGTYGQAHLLHAVNIPLSKLELEIDPLVPRRPTRIVLTDGGEGAAERTAIRLKELGYTSVSILDG